MSNDSLSALYPMSDTAHGTFDVAPVLAAINEKYPAGMAKALDESILYLTEYFLKDGEYNGLYYVELLCSLRMMRNAILKGAGFVDLEQD
ncbi:hypothetical protein [Pontibacter sp. HJ8]